MGILPVDPNTSKIDDGLPCAWLIEYHDASRFAGRPGIHSSTQCRQRARRFLPIAKVAGCQSKRIFGSDIAPDYQDRIVRPVEPAMHLRDVIARDSCQ